MGALTALAACGNDPAENATTATTKAAAAPTTVSATSPPADTAPPSEPPATAAPTTVDESWRDDAVAWCEQGTAGLLAIAPPSSPEDIRRYVVEFVAFRDAQGLAVPEWPAELTAEPYDLDGLHAQADGWIDRAVEQVAAGRLDGPEFSDTAHGSVDFFEYLMRQSAAILAIAGVPCGPADPIRMANADLNVPIFNAAQLETGFGSVWVSSGGARAVHRIDPDSGTELAVVDVGAAPFKLQPADGRMIVRTADAYVAIDPATNTVVDTLAKADVGPAADRSWAVDGAMWICDGQRVHRYDPVTFQPVTTIELGFDCGQVYATEELVVPWSYNQDDGESGTSRAAFIDPATNQVHQAVDLPVDVNVPIVLDDTVFLPGKQGSRAVVVDRANWTIVSTPQFDREMDGSQAAYDGTSIYVIADGAVAVVDPATFQVTETIEAFNFDAPARNGLNSVAASPGSLWVVNDDAGLLQRFDRPT